MEERRAAGFVLFRRAGDGHRYLLLRNARHGDVGLPKGHTEPGEDDRATALRETEEETGFDAGAVRPNFHFARTLRYPVKDRMKTVVYFAAEALAGDVVRSPEHDDASWRPLGDALAALQHEALRGVLRDAAIFLKDPALRNGLAPAEARALLEANVGAGAPVVAHSAQVAGMARAMAGAWGELDADFVEAAAWLHDSGRARSHGIRHPIEGFRLVCEAGHPGYAPPCLSHFLRGAAFDDLPVDEALRREMWGACDVTTFEPFERLVALADFLAKGDARVPLEERHRDLVARYGASPVIDRNLAVCRGLKDEFDRRTGASLYALLGIE
jgi:8-oxo-dGTP pyrophosphatase MutT (NUDIX family)